MMCAIAVAVGWAYNSKLSGEITPCDIPAMLVWVVGARLLADRRYRWLAVLAVAGVVVKETALVLAVPLLFDTSLPVARRMVRFGKVVACGLTVKVLMSGVVGTWAGGATLRRADTGEWNIASNIRDLIHDWPGNPLLTGGGMLAAALIGGRLSRPALAVFVVFLGSQFAFGLLHEHRIFLELVPVAVVALLPDRLLRLDDDDAASVLGVRGGGPVLHREGVGTGR